MHECSYLEIQSEEVPSDLKKISKNRGQKKVFHGLVGYIGSFFGSQDCPNKVRVGGRLHWTDASDRAVLSQTDQTGKEHPIAYYYLRKLLPREQRYAKIEKECLGIDQFILRIKEFNYVLRHGWMLRDRVESITINGKFIF